MQGGRGRLTKLQLNQNSFWVTTHQLRNDGLTHTDGGILALYSGPPLVFATNCMPVGLAAFQPSSLLLLTTAEEKQLHTVMSHLCSMCVGGKDEGLLKSRPAFLFLKQRPHRA